MDVHFAHTKGDAFEQMRLHFVDNSNERGQYALLIDEGVSATLASYAYLRSDAIRVIWEHLWSEQVRLHLVAWPTQAPQKDSLEAEGVTNHLMSYADKNNEGVYGEVWDENMRLHVTSAGGRVKGAHPEALIEEEQNQHLISYAYPQQEQIFGTAWKAQQEPPDLRPRVIIDSGAFTAWSSGKPIRPEDYGKWALEFDARWRDRMASLVFINLDVIGDQIGTWRNQEVLEKLGVDPIPVVTQGADIKHLTHALERYDYICLGGLVPLATRRTALRSWLDYCFAEVMRFKKETGKMRKIHLLGVTQQWVLNRYPVYSSDSSAWTQPLRFGGARKAGLEGKLPKYGSSDAALAATLHALRAEIRSFKAMEAQATKLWESRGIVWDK